MGSTATARRFVASRAARGLADGVVSVLLPVHLAALTLPPRDVGTLSTATLLGSAALTLAVGLGAVPWPRRTLLLAASALMVATGVGFALAGGFWALLALAVVGTLNPSSGDVSVFLPLEQAALAHEAEGSERAALLARWNVAGALAGAVGALLCSTLAGWPTTWGFWLYAALGVVAFMLYRGTPKAPAEAVVARAPLRESRGEVTTLALLFCLDSAGSGLVLDALVGVWLHLRFGLELAQLGALFFGARLLAALSQLASPVLARRFGEVNTMVFTHLPANLLLVVAAFAPNAGLAVAALLGRMALSRMDVPIRQALVMRLVPPAEREAAAAVTNVPRSLAAATTPVLAGLMLEASPFGWPLVIAGVTKVLYDLWLLKRFRPTPVVAAPR